MSQSTLERGRRAGSPDSRAAALPRWLAGRRSLPLLAVLGAGLVLRLILALVVYRGQGFAGDMQLFRSWADALTTTGPGAFYAAGGRVDYPPGYAYVLWALGAVSGAAAGLFGTTREVALVALLKLPAILADVGVAALAYRLAARPFGAWAGLAAAALYLFVPVTLYDSALWGQVDAVAALVMMAALALLYLFVPVTLYDSALWGQVDAVAALVMMAALALLFDGCSVAAAAAAVFAVIV
jgi:Gpi18-like mannosyltransferase